MKCGFRKDHGKVTENTFPVKVKSLRSRLVLGIVPLGGPFGTVSEVLFEKKQLIPALQQLLASRPAAQHKPT